MTVLKVAMMLLFMSVVCEAITEIIGASTLFAPIRNFIIKRRVFFLASLVECKHCLSVWVASLITVPTYVILFDMDAIGWLVMVFSVIVVHRFSNLFHIFFDIIANYKQWRWVIELKQD